MKITIVKNKIHFISLVFMLAASWANLPQPAWAETLTLGGTGSATPLVEQFARAYSSLKPEISVRVINPPMGSNGAIRAVLSGAIDLAVPGKPLTDADKARGGQDWLLGRTLLVFVTTKEPPPSEGFTIEQLAAIYSGKVTTWADGSPIRLVIRGPAEADTLILRKLSPAMEQAVDAALARPGLLVAANDLENLEVLEKTPGSLGTTNLGLMLAQNRKLSLHPLPIDSRTPTLATLEQGAYPYSKEIYVARGPKLSPAAQGFLDFLLSASRQEILERAGYLPAPHQP
ncbi:MAG: substrate-binding domain-containing protein [Candidatus Competibacteraceae bacterium]